MASTVLVNKSVSFSNFTPNICPTAHNNSVTLYVDISQYNQLITISMIFTIRLFHNSSVSV